MIIAHAPVGYIISKKIKTQKTSHIISSIIFSIMPDFDLIYYYFFDKTKTFHHLYFTHLPIVVAVVFLLLMPIYNSKIFKNVKPYAFLFFINWIIHLILDTFTGGIVWFYPLSNHVITFIKIPLLYKNWMASFVFHYSFIIELFLVGYAIFLFFKNIKKHNKISIT